MERSLKLVQQLLKYRAVDRSNFAIDQKILKDRNFFNRNPLPWLTDIDVEEGMRAAMRDVNIGDDGPVFFGNQLRYSDDGNDDVLSANRKTNDLCFSKMQAHHSKFVWYVNLTPIDRELGVMQRPAQGSHWVVVLLELPCTISQLHVHSQNITLSVRFFDPMGNSLPANVDTEFQRLINEQLVANAMRLNERLAASTLVDNIVINYDYENLGFHIQTDENVQCGIFCIWFLHQFLVNNMDLSDMANWKRPLTQNTPARREAFRLWYFRWDPTKVTTSSSSTFGKRKQTFDQGSTSQAGAIDLVSSDSD